MQLSSHLNYSKTSFQHYNPKRFNFYSVMSLSVALL